MPSSFFATIIFSSDLAAQCNSSERLLPTAIGLRKIRASSQLVRDAANLTKSRNSRKAKVFVPLISRSDNIKFTKIGEDGVERRMTKSEKKEARARIKATKKKNDLHLQSEQEEEGEKDDAIEEKKDDIIEKDSGSVSISQGSIEVDHAVCYGSTTNIAPVFKQNGHEKYYDFELDHDKLKEEIEELHFERKNINSVPAMLSQAMTNQAIRIGLLEDGLQKSLGYRFSEKNTTIDEDFGLKIANEIKDEVKRAEELRSREDMRPMAYRLVPEVWLRLRPKISKNERSEQIPATSSHTVTNINDSKQDSILASKAMQWMHVYMPGTSKRLKDHAVTLQKLWDLESIHVSCGAKFGCDFLIYDGNRNDRHAFAGMRVVSHTSKLPCPYDLAGMVRGLNTAGKLALLCVVSTHDSNQKVAFIDLALEKVLLAPTHIKRNRKDQRKEVGKNLSKKHKGNCIR